MVNREEFSQIIGNKANMLDLQAVVKELLKHNSSTDKNQKLVNLLSDSTMFFPSTYEDELEQLEQLEKQEMLQRKDELYRL